MPCCPKFLEAIGKTTASEQLYALNRELSALVGKLDAAQAQCRAAPIPGGAREDHSLWQRDALGQGLSALVASSMQPRPRRWCPKFLEMIEKTTDSDQLYALGQGLSALAASSMQPRPRRWCAKFLEMIEKTTDSGQLDALGQGLSALAGKLDADQKAYAWMR